MIGVQGGAFTDSWAKLRKSPIKITKAHYFCFLWASIKPLKIAGLKMSCSGFLTFSHKPLSVTTQTVCWQKWKGCSSCFLSLWLLPVFRLHDWHQHRPKHIICVTQFPWQCTLAACCSGTQAEGGYSIQNHDVLWEEDNSGRGLGSVNPEALHLISSTTERHARCQLIQETRECSRAMTDYNWC